MPARKLTLTFILFSLALLFSFYIYQKEFGWFTLNESGINKLSNQAITDAANFRFEKAIQGFKRLNFIYKIKGEDNLAARMMIKVGFQYSKKGDYRTGVPIVKKVAFNEKLSPEIRSEAIARLLMSYSGRESKEIMKEIFSDNNKIIKDALGNGNVENLQDLRKAAIKLFEKAESIHEYAYLNYVLAARKSYIFLDNLKKLDNKQTKERIEEILSLIKRGDELTKEEIIRDDFVRGGFNYDFLPSGQSQKLQAFANLARMDSKYEKLAADVFNGLNAIRDKYYKNGYKAPSYLGTESFIRFYYASMLASLHGYSKKDEIGGIIAPTMIADGNWGVTNKKVIWEFYKNELTRPYAERGSNYKSIIEIASLDPDFNKFILGKDWLEY